MPGLPQLVPFAFGWVALSAMFTWLALRYAQRRGMFDQPGQRRSHVQTTPRGGGVAMVLTMIVAAYWMGFGIEPWSLLVFSISLAAVAGIGWIDDHSPLSARARLLVHLGAAFAFAGVLAYESAGWPNGLAGFVLMAVATLWLAACVNFWNFVDGSNGLVTLQSAFVAAVVFAWHMVSGAADEVQGPWAVMALVMLCACLGFLPFNFPKARIFMGDVGSGGLGFACGALLLATVTANPDAFWPMLLAPSALLMDASLTLASRILNKRRWTKPHREHLYQWLIRTGRSHAHVAMFYLAWCLFVIAPGIVTIKHWPSHAPLIAVSILAVEAILWWTTKRRLLRDRRSR